MPVERRQISQLLLFADGFLQATLSEAALTGSGKGADRLHRLALTHRQQTAAPRQALLDRGPPGRRSGDIHRATR